MNDAVPAVLLLVNAPVTGAFTINNTAGTASFNVGSTYVSGALGVGGIGGTTVGAIYAYNDVYAYYSSDERLKENVLTISGSLDILKQIGGYTFDWKEMPGIHDNKGHDVGVIAQEIEKVLPELVTTRDNGYKAVKYEKLVALLIEGIKEQQLQIEDLKLEVADLKKQKGL